jgi:DNA mismatch repair protein MutS2
MNEKSAKTLELPKILAQLARYTTFSAGKALALELTPTPDIDAARQLQEETSEARVLLETKQGITLGGVHDVREQALSCTRGFILDTSTLLNIQSTLRRATTLRRILGKLKHQFPLLAEIVDSMEECTDLQMEIGRVVNENGEVKDSASAKLAMLRRDVRVAFDRLQSKIHNIATSSSNTKYLQEPIVTQRNGRYVVPLKAEFKGRIPGVVHDQSASGATLFIEPLTTVELNNSYRELQIEEENEVRRILAALSDFVGREADNIVVTVEELAYLDLVFARSKYAGLIDANQPELVPFKDTTGKHPGSTIRIFQARHPLLDPEEVVPIDVDIDDDTYALVITGPNTGGKTVALKTIGLMCLMAQCGLHLPTAPGSQLSIFEDIYADIGDEQSIEQSLSTFSSHMTNIIQILKQANWRSLVILDELGAGTDPTEGSALARALLNELLKRSITTLVSTHHPELKAFSYNTPGVRNASVEFNLETLAPTYRLIIGLPGRSNALAIASRLGLSEGIITNARDIVSTDELEVDNLLEEIHKTRDEIGRALDRAKAAEDDAEFLREQLEERLDNIAEERRELLQEAQQQIDTEIAELHKEIRRLRRELQAAGQPLDALRQVQESARRVEEAAVIAQPQREEEKEEPSERHQFRLGESVWVPTLNTEGQISEISEEEAEIQVGRLRVRSKLDELQPLTRSERRELDRKRKKSPVYEASTDTTFERGSSPGLELDLRGSRVEEAVPRVEDYLDAAYMAALPFVRIIHGKGTGALRQAIRQHLSQHPLVAKHSSGNPKEGGSGVTVVHLVPQA